MAMSKPERDLEEALLSKLRDLKYEYRPDIRDRATLEANFRKKFEALNRVTLTDGEFQRLLDEIVTPDVYEAARSLRNREAFKRQNQLAPKHIKKIIDTYQFRKEEDRYSKRIGMERIAEEGYNLNISRYISTAEQEIGIDLAATHDELIEIEKQIRESTATHNAFLKELGLSSLPGPDLI